jgi:hypothetical protein
MGVDEMVQENGEFFTDPDTGKMREFFTAQSQQNHRKQAAHAG